MSSTQVYHGSCHCGDVNYQMRLTLPPKMDPDPTAETVRIYKCNCTTCHKMGMFHCRPIHPAEDFILTSPASIEELGTYRVFAAKFDWYFCKKCGVRPFVVGGNWVQEELDIDVWAGKDDGDGTLSKVWKSTPLENALGRNGKPMHYISANAVTLEGVDLIDWHDKKWMFYYGNREENNGTLNAGMAPFSGGCY